MNNNEPLSDNDAVCLTVIICVIAVCITAFQITRLCTGNY